MRVALMAMLLAAAPVAAQKDPAELRVTEVNGSLSYEIVNALPYPIVAFDVTTQFTSPGYQSLACTIHAFVKGPSDLVTRNVCDLPRDAKNGKRVTYVTRLVSVEWARGLKWTPPEDGQ
ncbi:MAG TPA: hypothetical protein VMI94_18945 [Bryobacteraceae bacterium]|nr:hypothetical protein [Bryobacteraceae bacterium]